jgi:hypothetical protein
VARKSLPGVRDRSAENASAVAPPTSWADSPCSALRLQRCARSVGAIHPERLPTRLNTRGVGSFPAVASGGRGVGGAGVVPVVAAIAAAAAVAAWAMGRWPVHLQRLPATARSSSIGVAGACPGESRRAYSAMTTPGVQKPHCVAWPVAMHSCTARPASVRAAPSTVVTQRPSTLASGVRHATTGRRWLPSGSEITTVQEPQAPTSQPSFRPTQRSASLSQLASVVSGSPPATVRGTPLSWMCSTPSGLAPAALPAARAGAVRCAAMAGSIAEEICCAGVRLCQGSNLKRPTVLSTVNNSFDMKIKST